MALLLTSLSVDYQRNSWSLAEALRELVANALDAEEEFKHEQKGQMELDYDSRKLIFTITTKGVTVNPKALLMGTSNNRAIDKCIGQFGEGLPMALLVLAREGWKITIFNGKEKWTPQIVKAEEYDNAKVLGIHTRSLITPREDFVIQIEDIEQAEVEAVYHMFLKLDKNLPTHLRYVASLLHHNEVIIHPDYQGRIYIKGVFVNHNPNWLYGYNINNVSLNRDRKFADPNSIGDAVADTISGLLNTNSNFLALFTERLFSTQENSPELSQYSYYIQYNSKLQEAVRAYWLHARFTAHILCRTEDEANSMRTLGFKPFLVNTVVYDILSPTVKGYTFSDVQKALETTFTEVIEVNHKDAVKLVKLHTLMLKLYPDLPPHVQFVKFNLDTNSISLTDEFVNISYLNVSNFKVMVTSYVRGIVQHSNYKNKIYSEDVYRALIDSLLD